MDAADVKSAEQGVFDNEESSDDGFVDERLLVIGSPSSPHSPLFARGYEKFAQDLSYDSSDSEVPQESEKIESEAQESESATKIQSIWRGYRARRELHIMQTEIEIERSFSQDLEAMMGPTNPATAEHDGETQQEEEGEFQPESDEESGFSETLQHIKCKRQQHASSQEGDVATSPESDALLPDNVDASQQIYISPVPEQTEQSTTDVSPTSRVRFSENVNVVEIWTKEEAAAAEAEAEREYEEQHGGMKRVGAMYTIDDVSSDEELEEPVGIITWDFRGPEPQQVVNGESVNPLEHTQRLDRYLIATAAATAAAAQQQDATDLNDIDPFEEDSASGVVSVSENLFTDGGEYSSGSTGVTTDNDFDDDEFPEIPSSLNVTPRHAAEGLIDLSSGSLVAPELHLSDMASSTASGLSSTHLSISVPNENDRTQNPLASPLGSLSDSASSIDDITPLSSARSMGNNDEAEEDGNENALQTTLPVPEDNDVTQPLSPAAAPIDSSSFNPSTPIVLPVVEHIRVSFSPELPSDLPHKQYPKSPIGSAKDPTGLDDIDGDQTIKLQATSILDKWRKETTPPPRTPVRSQASPVPIISDGDEYMPATPTLSSNAQVAKSMTFSSPPTTSSAAAPPQNSSAVGMLSPKPLRSPASRRQRGAILGDLPPHIDSQLEFDSCLTSLSRHLELLADAIQRRVPSTESTELLRFDLLDSLLYTGFALQQPPATPGPLPLSKQQFMRDWEAYESPRGSSLPIPLSLTSPLRPSPPLPSAHSASVDDVTPTTTITPEPIKPILAECSTMTSPRIAEEEEKIEAPASVPVPAPVSPAAVDTQDRSTQTFLQSLPKIFSDMKVPKFMTADGFVSKYYPASALEDHPHFSRRSPTPPPPPPPPPLPPLPETPEPSPAATPATANKKETPIVPRLNLKGITSLSLGSTADHVLLARGKKPSNAAATVQSKPALKQPLSIAKPKIVSSTASTTTTQPVAKVVRPTSAPAARPSPSVAKPITRPVSAQPSRIASNKPITPAAPAPQVRKFVAPVKTTTAPKSTTTASKPKPSNQPKSTVKSSTTPLPPPPIEVPSHDQAENAIETQHESIVVEGGDAQQPTVPTAIAAASADVEISVIEQGPPLSADELLGSSSLRTPTKSEQQKQNETKTPTPSSKKTLSSGRTSPANGRTSLSKSRPSSSLGRQSPISRAMSPTKDFRSPSPVKQLSSTWNGTSSKLLGASFNDSCLPKAVDVLSKMLSPTSTGSQVDRKISELFAETWSQVLEKADPETQAYVNQMNAKEEQVKNEWYHVVMDALQGQRIHPQVSDSEVMFKEIMETYVDANVERVRMRNTKGESSFSPKIIVAGPKRSGKTTILHFLAKCLTQKMRECGQWSSTFVVPVNWALMLGREADLEAFAFRWLKYVIELLVCQLPSLEPHKKALITVFGKITTTRSLPHQVMPPSFREEYDTASISIKLWVLKMQQYWFSGHQFVEFVNQIAMFPSFISQVFGLSSCLFIMDNFDLLAAHLSVPSSDPDMSSLNLAVAMKNALRTEAAVLSGGECYAIMDILSSSPDSGQDDFNIREEFNVLVTTGLVAKEDLPPILKEPVYVEDQSVLTPVDVITDFFGSPAYLAQLAASCLQQQAQARTPRNTPRAQAAPKNVIKAPQFSEIRKRVGGASSPISW